MTTLITETLSLNRETLAIIELTLRMAFLSTAISAVLGTWFALFLERTSLIGRGAKSAIVRLTRTLMGTPPVVVGLFVYILLMRKGVFGKFGLLFTVRAMVVAQILIVTPIICGMVYSYAVKAAPKIRAFAVTMGADKAQTRRLLIREMRGEIYFAVIAGFGRAISEVGSVMIVGGNILHKTRTMTTTIAMLRNKGEFAQAITLGVILLLIAFGLQMLTDLLRIESVDGENF